MADILLVSDRPLQPHEKFLADCINELTQYDVKGIAVVVLTNPGDYTLTCYHSMCLQDKQLAEGAIQSDIVDGIVQANIRKYIEKMEEEDEEDGNDGSDS